MKFKFYNNLYSFQPKLIPSIATIVGFGILLSLCLWQVQRLSWKKDLIETRVSRFENNIRFLEDIKDPLRNEFTRVKVEGKFLNEKEMFMPALSKNGNNGFHILVVLKQPNGKNIIFDTGWIPTRKKNKQARMENIDNLLSVKEAVIRLPGRKGKYQPDNDPDDNFWFYVEPEKMKDFLNTNVEHSFYLEAVNNGPGGYPLGGQTRIYIRNNHLQYAITWFLIACTLVGVFLASSIVRQKK